MKVTSIRPGDMTQASLHALLLSAIAPRPISFASTMDREGNINLSPFSFFNIFSSNPPILIFSPSRRGRDGSNKHTYDNVVEVPECVINIVTFPMVEQMSLASSEYDKGVNEFKKAGFTEVASEMVRPPRIAESPVALECKVNQVISLGDQGGAGNLVICEVLMIHVQEKYLNEKGHLDTTKLELVGRMGEMWYVKAFGDALFEIPKPINPVGIGVDALPEHVFQSTILTGNDLGRLGNISALPRLDEVSDWVSSNSERDFDKNIYVDLVANHKAAKLYLSKGNIKSALFVLLSYHGK
jgi:flavin reductase (DIM6/NTAB) family NADH-FMN oxidoreductase RutF